MPKIIHYRHKCIGCNICYEMQPDLWRISRKDGKATLIGADIKKGLHILSIREDTVSDTNAVVKACPVNIILLNR